MELVVVGVALEVVDGLLPVRREDILVLPIEALVNICPWSCVELRGRISLSGQLAVCEQVLVVDSGQERPVVSLGFGEGQTNRCARA